MALSNTFRRARSEIEALIGGGAGTVNVRVDGGAVGDGSTDDTVAIQSCINEAGEGGTVIFPSAKQAGGFGGYACNNLVMPYQRQIWIGSGINSVLIKNASGPIVTVTGKYFQANSIHFYGYGYSGDNVVVSEVADGPAFVTCSSTQAAGRALLSRANETVVYGHGGGGAWQTSDSSASGFDIELDGTLAASGGTLYHTLFGIYTGQSTGGIKLTNAMATIVASEFGKLTKSGSGGGSPGGTYSNNRILGHIVCDSSLNMFTANLLGTASNVTFGVGTSGCRWDVSNVTADTSVFTNDGNANNLIMREVSAGGTTQIMYGDDSATAIMDVGTVAGTFAVPSMQTDNNAGYYQKDTGGTSRNILTLNASDRLFVSGPGDVTVEASGAHYISFANNGATKLYIDGTTGYTRFGGNSGPLIATGSGSPEGAVTAPVGSIYMRTNGGAGTSIYVKESGSGNTGWVGK